MFNHLDISDDSASGGLLANVLCIMLVAEVLLVFKMLLVAMELLVLKETLVSKELLVSKHVVATKFVASKLGVVFLKKMVCLLNKGVM